LIVGSVDGFEGSYVTGWAIAVPDDHSCTIDVFDGAGRLVGSGRATRARPDLSSLGYGRSTFSFRVPVTELGSTDALRVCADGIELPGCPVPVGSGLYDGYFTVSRGYASGWVAERRAGFLPPLIRLVDQNGEVVATGASTIDGTENDPHFRPARFRFPLPSSCFGKPELRLCAIANEVAFGTPATCALRLTGFLDSFSPERCAGWLLSPDVPNRHFEIEVLRNGEVVGKGCCDLPRADLCDGYPESWEVGFDIPLVAPDQTRTLVDTMSIRLAGSDVELFDGPFVVGRRPAMVATARRVAQLSHGTTAQLSVGERTVLQSAMAEFAENQRRGPDYVVLKQAAGASGNRGSRRLTVVIPIYANVKVTQACIASVLRHRSPALDAVVLVNDCSPDAGMAAMLEEFAREPDVYLLTDETNLGFVRSVNRALAFCQAGDVVLLNSDTQVFEGGLTELWRVANSAPDIGTVTAMSNNATIFSYPHPDTPKAALDDADWAEIASLALRENAGVTVDVPTGHGFCMLVRRDVLNRLGKLNESFGRGYGEENELCLRASDLGYRHVAAAGVFVEHRESISFGGERAALLKANMPKLQAMFPEYDLTILDYIKRDELRRARQALDVYRMRKATGAGARYVLVIENWLGGGTVKAAADIEAMVGYGQATTLRLSCAQSGAVELETRDPYLRATFPADDTEALFDLLAEADINLILIHQLLGYSAEFVTRLGRFVEGRRSVFYAHDFFPICPRVNMIDALGEFCGRADVERCKRCVEVGGAHEASRLTELDPAEHRSLFADLLGRIGHVIAPSADTAFQMSSVIPDLTITSIPHPHLDATFPQAARTGSDTDIVLLGAIGPHKGSAKLLEIARRARLNHPAIRFHVIGYTDIDAQLISLGNVTITGRYDQADLPRLLSNANGRFALFLHGWPETFSFTLTEAVTNGLIPIVPDIGAPAERVRAAGFGVVYSFPIDAREVLDVISGLAEGRVAPYGDGGTPMKYATPASGGRIAELFGLTPVSERQSAGSPRQRRARDLART
jgi:GT2 family glycosyltransferase